MRPIVILVDGFFVIKKVKRKIRMKNSIKTVIIENIYPEIDGGKFAVKREVGDKFYVFADVYKGGHEAIVVNLKFRYAKEISWKKVAMKRMPDRSILTANSFIKQNMREEII